MKIIFLLLNTLILILNLTFSQQFINPSLDNTKNPYIDSNLKNKPEDIKLKNLFDQAPRPEQSNELITNYIKGNEKRESLLEKIAKLLGIKDILSGPGEGKYAFALYIKKIINFFLSILAFIALIVLIIGFSKMLLHMGGDSEATKTAKTYIKAAAISLILIGLSWFIVSFIFNIILR